MLRVLLLPLGQASLNLFKAAVEIDPLYWDAGGLELLAVAGFESGAGEDCGLVAVVPGLNAGAEAGEPGGAIAIRQGFSSLHFGFIRVAVEVVRIGKAPTQLGGEQLANGAFAAAGNAHDDHDVSRLDCHVA